MSERPRLTCELHDLGVAMMRQNLRRRHPEMSESQIDSLLQQWLPDDPTNRPQDMVDVRALLQTMSSEETESARDAVQLIEQRGFNRKMNLLERFNRFMQHE